MSLISKAELDELARRIRESLAYNPETGDLIWLKPNISWVKIGTLAGTVVSSRGYRAVRLNGRAVLSHRIAWLLYYGDWPKGDLDHINRRPADNRIANLREATRSQNMGNSRKKKRDGLKGAFWNKRNKRWLARVGDRYLGYHGSEDAAHAAYMAAAREYFGEFARDA